MKPKPTLRARELAALIDATRFEPRSFGPRVTGSMLAKAAVARHREDDGDDDGGPWTEEIEDIRRDRAAVDAKAAEDRRTVARLNTIWRSRHLTRDQRKALLTLAIGHSRRDAAKRMKKSRNSFDKILRRARRRLTHTAK